MQILLPQTPPQVSVALAWRDLYGTGAFGQRELAEGDALRSAAEERSLRVGSDRGLLESLDLQGALSPIAFSAGYMSGFEVPAQPVDSMRFREEEGAIAWEEYRWEQDGFATVTALYSPWQLLYLDDVLRVCSADLPLDTLLASQGERDGALDSLREWLERQQVALGGMDRSWQPLIKLLVALQNRYRPRFTGRESIIGIPGGGWIRAGHEWATEDAESLKADLGCTVEQVTAAYHFLVERGLTRDPRDGLTLLRRAQQRAFHTRWRGDIRRAQDNFDAAQTLWEFLTELQGTAPGRPQMWPLDGRQIERGELFDRGPATPWEEQDLKIELRSADLYPHGVHVVGEGASEDLVIQRLTEQLLGRDAARSLSFTDLGGSGSAKKVVPLTASLAGYASRAVVIVDNEGQMASYLKTAIDKGEIEATDILLFDGSLESDNASASELISLAQQIGARPAPGGEPIEFDISPRELEDYHAERVRRSPPNGAPGLAESLITLVSRKTDGRFRLDKLDLVEALAQLLIDEVRNTPSKELEAVLAHRPIVRFFFERIEPVLNRPLPAGHQI